MQTRDVDCFNRKILICKKRVFYWWIYFQENARVITLMLQASLCEKLSYMK